MKGAPLCLLVFCSIVSVAAADELRLKDGTKIVGTIVGFEDNSFKVQTSYGFALVRKDKVAVIIPTQPKPEATEAPADSKKSSPQPGPGAHRATAPATPPSLPASMPAPKKEIPAPPAPAFTAQPGAPVAGQTAAPPAERRPEVAAVAPPAAAIEPAPPVIREEVQGNLYINHTYGFRMYKPPGWGVIEGAQKTLPTAIVAMGTGDETTLLVVGRERLKGFVDSHAAATEQQLREIYENYRRLSEERSRVAGLPALARRFRGTVDGHDWSGIVLSFARGNEVFTILGMTYADSDLIQIQENVIAKTIASLEFLKP